MMMLVVSADIGMRLLGRPMAGAYEIIGWLSAGAMALSLGYVQLHRGHVAMTLLSSRLSGRAALLLSGLMDLIAMLLFLFVSRFIFNTHGRYLPRAHCQRRCWPPCTRG